jgi:hypothetical protein
MRNALLGLLLILASLPQYTVPQHTGATAASGGGGVTWSLIQHPHNFTGGASAVSVTTSAVGSGNLLIVLWAAFSTGTSVSGNAVSATGETFTECPTHWFQAYNYTGANYESTDCFYVLSATGGETSVTFTPTWIGASSQSQDVEVIEYKRSTGTATYDTGNVSTNNACTSCAAPALSGFSGSNAEVCVQFGGANQVISAISGSYTNPGDFDATNVTGGFAGNLSVSSYSAPSWTLSSTTNTGLAMGAACWK